MGNIMNLDDKFNELLRFLKTNPEFLSIRRRDFDLNRQEDINYLRDRFKSQRRTEILLSEPKTVSDIAVDHILHSSRGYDNEKLKAIQSEHKLVMSAENLVGELLEMYIAEKLEPFGWIWCSGNFVKAVDFIYPKDNDTWNCLQIKNRDNTENSSSSKIRDGKEINKWFRAYSRKDATNWENFPDLDSRIKLTEEEFLEFVRKSVKKEDT